VERKRKEKRASHRCFERMEKNVEHENGLGQCAARQSTGEDLGDVKSLRDEVEKGAMWWVDSNGVGGKPNAEEGGGA